MVDDVHARVPGVGGSGAEGRGTPEESERADAAATPAQAGETLHMHSVASAAKRQRGPQLSRSARKRAAMRASDDA